MGEKKVNLMMLPKQNLKQTPKEPQDYKRSKV